VNVLPLVACFAAFWFVGVFCAYGVGRATGYDEGVQAERNRER
jgi:hypothetical protein